MNDEAVLAVEQVMLKMKGIRETLAYEDTTDTDVKQNRERTDMGTDLLFGG